ncbi:MAG: CHASE domain-containing protein [Sphingomonadales bacterium]|nr:CHASE domain-containing protein [Sphingomonadales bacterium]
MIRLATARARAERWYTSFPRAFPWAIGAAVMMVAALVVIAIEQVNAERLHSQLHAVAAGVGGALERRASAHVTFLRAGALLLGAGGAITGKDLSGLAAAMSDDAEERGRLTITWAPLVPVRGLDAFVAARRAEGMTGFTVHPLPGPGREFLVPVTYVSNPHQGPGPTEGYDMASEPLRRAAMERAAHARRPVATTRIELFRPDTGRPRTGFLIYMPVYARAERGRLLGFLASPINARQFLEAAQAAVPSRGFELSLYDGAVAPDRLLARVPGERDPDIGFALPVTIAGKPLLLLVSGHARGALTPLSVATLVAGLLLALALAVLAWLVTRHAEQDRARLDWFEQQESIRNTLTRELNHRVKNTLASVISIIALTRRRTRDLDEFADNLTARILALSATHDLLTGLGWRAAPLREVIAVELKPYSEGRDQLVHLEGPELALAPNDALLLGLAIHELATNAGKYGALSVISGEVLIRWELIRPTLARVCWQERGGPPVPHQRRRGFGTDLLERIVAHELGSGVDLVFATEGVCCTLSVPVRSAAEFRVRAVKPAGS